MFKKVILIMLKSIITIAIALLFISFPLMWCWNYTMPLIFNLPSINWLQAYCIGWLSQSLFKGFNGSQLRTNK
jgi:hypothetical protein